MKIITVDNRSDLAELLVLLQEEAAEVSQAASKLIRFGLTAHNPASEYSNLQELTNELTDILTIISLIVDHSDIEITRESITNERVFAKLKKIAKNSTYWTHLDDLENL